MPSATAISDVLDPASGVPRSVCSATSTSAI
jgi:hypothetical protein